MTTITVTAGDTAQAMDKIVERLGEDALILETVKRNGRIEMIATDDPEDAPIPLALGRSSDAEEAVQREPLDLEIGSTTAFTDLFDQQMINRVRRREDDNTSAAENLVGRAIEASDNLEVLSELRGIRTMLNGMMITHPEGLDVTLGHAAPVRLHQAGFSPKAIQTLHHYMVGLDDGAAVMAFMDALADKVVHPDVDSFSGRALFLSLAAPAPAKPRLRQRLRPISRNMAFPSV